MQTKRQSLIETCSNTAIGMTGSWMITMVCITSIAEPFTATSVTVLLCTVWSLVRGYMVRRYFKKVSYETPNG